MRTHVDLFSGIGGFALAAHWAGVETIAFAEIDPYASRVIERRFPGVRNYGDVRHVPTRSAWLLTGGVPCQPASVAGKRRGAEDDRWLWPEALAVVERGNYEWVLFENPTGILSLNNGVEFERICAAMESKGYEVQPLVIPACGVGALHRRNRIWIMAHATGTRLPQRDGQRDQPTRQRAPELERRGKDVAHPSCERVDGGGNARQGRRAESSNGSQAVAHTDEPRSQGRERGIVPERSGQQSLGPGSAFADANGESMGRTSIAWSECNQWAVEPNVGRVADGIPKRVDRLRCLGNAIVPQVAYQLIKRMIEAEEVS
jgi:DNA (cytosine-5)-methyltransferase 1